LPLASRACRRGGTRGACEASAEALACAESNDGEFGELRRREGRAAKYATGAKSRIETHGVSVAVVARERVELHATAC
jgi:hypothetical protein